MTDADMTFTKSRPRRALVGVFDAGIGGVPLAAALVREGHQVVYLGDAARRPYGPLPHSVVESYVRQAEAFFADAGCDVWVIACNTASVVAPSSLRGLIPCVDMVSAVVAKFGPSGSGPLGLLATEGTTTSGAYARALASYDLHQVATEELLRLAEEGSEDHDRIRSLAADAFERLRQAKCDTAVLACTDFTCILPDLAEVADGMRLFDPLTSAVQLVGELVSRLHLPDRTDATPRLVLTGPHPVDVPSFARERYELHLPAPEYVNLATFGVM